MSKKENVLIFPAESENAIEIYDSLKYNLHFNLFGATGKSGYAEFIYPDEKLFIGDLYINGHNFIKDFNNVIKRYDISFIIPTHDTIAVYLKRNKEKINAKIIGSPYETARIAENKYLTYMHLKDSKYYPKVYEEANEVDIYPVFLKPYIGVGSKGTFIAKDKKMLNNFIEENNNVLICEYLPGEEYTVDCFTDKNGELLFCGPRKRARINMGISYRAERVDNYNDFLWIAKELNSQFKFQGAWFFQVKENKNKELKIMEFSVRQAGTMVFYRQLGVNFAALSLFDAMEYDLSIIFNDYDLTLDRGIKNSFKFNYEYTTLYIDYDDTLIVENQVNTSLIKLIYQSLNKNKKIILLTKHEYDLDESLRNHRICKELFNKIIILKPHEEKSDYIIEQKSIFIDNYFKERKMVSEKCNIPVFDVDAVECLLDSTQI